ncbi:Conserved_hypothetical protein [Hexamita inflata]|uniref:Uncharacterized protein n=1 Tax=Hexamita inflata TaxID=28002 RepID=A0ABP1I9E4_9EUKA
MNRNLDTQEIKQDLIVSIDEHQNIQNHSKKKQFKKTFSDYVLGKFSRRQFYVHVYGGFVLMLFCYFMAFILYPKENGYSIFKQTYSNLGSFDSISNYRGWYFYSLLQFISFFVNFPMAFYQHYRLKLINNLVSIIACIAMLMGAVCQLFLGFFPASVEPLYKTIMIGDIHNNVGYTGFASCLLGYVLYSVLSVIDRSCSKNKQPILNHLYVDLTLAFIIIMFLLTTTAICSWLVIYPKLKEIRYHAELQNGLSVHCVLLHHVGELLRVLVVYIQLHLPSGDPEKNRWHSMCIENKLKGDWEEKRS